ncbi:YqaJ viral recombinase family protein [Frigoribacterium endophyticum]|jgi:hypothetical protein|uniref:YqaJ viral recombinase family protein n=1 Tax=Frigoribacterium endophyticum TaxID=1522176 RepID=UPI001FBA5157|nr:YqaJ viral recombinase family protein [Frigoribacterium endophyticum]NII50050.1 hypothetical protein [Frigoribacterium endophyticum]
MSIVQPMLSLWDDEPTPPAPPTRPAHEQRVLADSSDRIAWLRARSRGITATDVARLSSPRAVQAVVLDKLYGNGFGGNAYTDHGRAREPEIARWVLAEHRIAPSSKLFHAADRPRHLATPDGVAVRADGAVELCEIKTTKKAWTSIPRSYLRQVFWQQYVLGAERTLVVWEQHVDFVPLDAVPMCRWVDRDDDEIHRLVGLADTVLDTLARQAPVDPFAPGVRAYEPPPYDPLR